MIQMKYILIICAVLMNNACNRKPAEVDLNKGYSWYKEAKKDIIQQSDLQYDKVCTKCYGGGVYKDVHYFSNDHQFLIKEYKNGKLYVVKHFSKGNNFELRTKLHSNGVTASEGILYRGSYCGIYRSWYENGRLHEFGMKYRGDDVGKRKVWDRSMMYTEITENSSREVKMPDRID